MKKQFTFLEMEHSNTIEEYANEKLTKIEKFLEHEKEPIFMHITFTAQPTHGHHRVNLHISGPHYNFDVHRFGPDLYDLISSVADVMFHQLTEAKRKLVDTRQTGIKRE
jgi:ribosomal subunit interface protein